MENTLVPLASYPIWGLDTAGFKRGFFPSNIGVFLKNMRAQSEATEMLKRFSPDAVIGTGGYACYPIVKAASKMGIFTALHESNAVPGLAVKALKNSVDKIFVSFDRCISALGKGDKCIYTGNPVKIKACAESRKKAREGLGITGKYRYLIVSFGGSLGAQAVNRISLDIMNNLVSKRSDILHIHSCGKIGAGDFFERFKELGLDKCKNIRASEYIYNMEACLNAADVVICRSGAMTLSELATVGVASVLVPSPNVTGNHQYKNALEFSIANAAFLIDERNAGDEANACRYVSALLSNKVLREQMAENAKKFASFDAADRIVSEIIDGIKSKASY